MPVAASPAPTVAALAMGRSRSRNLSWLIALALGSGVVFAQARAVAGQLQPIHKPPPKTQNKPPTESQLQLAAQAKLKGDHKAGHADGVQQPVAGKVDAAGMEARWQEIQTALRPRHLIALCDEFQRDFPSSPLEPQIKDVQAGARRAMDIQRSAGLSGDLFEDPIGDSGYRDNLIRAVRGDKDAAYRIALANWTGTSGVVPSMRRTEQWLRFAAELGNGLASWELAQMYNRVGLVADAARFEKKALDLGYRPPPRLPTRGY
jgi:TPR repeat protein